jgi:hypothetical protein
MLVQRFSDVGQASSAHLVVSALISRTRQLETDRRSTYLECQKSTISSTTLIVAGLGVVLGIFLLGGGSLWLISRRRAARRNPDLGDQEAAAGGEPQGAEKSRRTVKQGMIGEEEESEDQEEEGEEPEKLRNERKRIEVVKREKEPPRVIQKGAKSESEDGEEDSDGSGESEEDEQDEDDVETPRPAKTAPSPLHQAANVQIRPRQTFGAAPSGTPVLSSSPEPLYPANPSPNPRHLRQSRPLQPSHPFATTKNSTPYTTSSHTTPSRGASPLPPPRAASRSAQSQRRDSVVSVRKGSAGVETGNVPPMPVRRQTEGNTRPLTIRKSSASTLMQSYYETPAQPLPSLPSTAPSSRSLTDRRPVPGQAVKKSPPSSAAPHPSQGERRPSARAGTATGGAGTRTGDGRRPRDRSAMI